MKLFSTLLSVVATLGPVMSVQQFQDTRVLQVSNYTAPPSKCEGRKVAVITSHCPFHCPSNGFGWDSWIEQINDVFGSHTCIDVDTSPSDQSLAPFDVIIVEGTDYASAIVSDWLMMEGVTQTLESRANAGAAIWINQMFLHTSNYNILRLPFGVELYANDLSLFTFTVIGASLLGDGHYQSTAGGTTLVGDKDYNHGYGVAPPLTYTYVSNKPGSQSLIKSESGWSALVQTKSNADTPVLVGSLPPPSLLAPKPDSYNVFKNILVILCDAKRTSDSKIDNNTDNAEWKVIRMPNTTIPDFNNPSIATEQVANCTRPSTTCIGPYGHPVVTMIFGVPTLTANNRVDSTPPVPALGTLAFVSNYSGYSSGVCSGSAPTGLTQNYDGTPTLVRDANTGTYTIKTKLDPSQISTSLSFCVRVELRLGTGSSGGYDIVSYEEFAVTITTTFDGTTGIFGIEEQTVEGYQISQGSVTGNAIINLNAFHCDSSFNVITTGIAMGQVMHLCIRDDNTYIAPATRKKFTSANATSLQLFQDNDVVDITQNLIPSTANKAGLLLGISRNSDNTVMKFEILLTEEFYRTTPTSPRPLRITGSVTGLTTTRRLLRNEDSSEQMLTKEDGEFQVIIEPEGIEPNDLSLTVFGLVIVGSWAIITLLAVTCVCCRRRRIETKKDEPTKEGASSKSQEQIDI